MVLSTYSKEAIESTYRVGGHTALRPLFFSALKTSVSLPSRRRVVTVDKDIR
jgi:hypothetical protein